MAQVADWIVQSAESVPAREVFVQAVEGTRTFAQLVAHIIDGYHYYCRLAKGPVEWSDTAEKTASTKAELLKQLARGHRGVHQACPAASSTRRSRTWGTASLHYGNMVVYLRLMGIVPASSK